jgi:hypothetical protein
MAATKTQPKPKETPARPAPAIANDDQARSLYSAVLARAGYDPRAAERITREVFSVFPHTTDECAAR